MTRGAQICGLAAVAVALASSRADAGIADVTPPAPGASVIDRARAGDFMLNVSAASVGSGNGATSFLAGYDGARASGVFEASAEAFVASRLVFRAAAAYLPSETRTTTQPQVELRWQLLRDESGVTAASLGLIYRRDSFTDDGGMIQGVFAAARDLGRVVILANVAYGQDPEGDDRLTEVRLASLFRPRASLVLGATGTAASGWGSTDRRRATRGDANDQIQLGVSAVQAFGAWALVVQLGEDVLRTTSIYAGPFALGGVAAAF